MTVAKRSDKPQTAAVAAHEEREKVQQSLRALGKTLGDAETSELWTKWAVAQEILGRPGEAAEGFHRAVELDGRNFFAAERYLALSASKGVPYDDSSQIEDFLNQLAGNDENENAYLRMHVRRYLATLRMLPPAAQPGGRLLELGAAFHHLTLAMIRFRGYSDVSCSDLWEGEARCLRSRSAGGTTYTFAVDNFDVELAPWPYTNAAFRVVLCCELLEHLVLDPMCVLAEINRVLGDDGLLLLTTPNLASAKSVASVFKARSPYIYGKFEPGGRPTDRHNREYTPGEVTRLLADGGFSMIEMKTQDSWWRDQRFVLRHLAAIGMPVALRGDNILCLARKTGPIRNRFPSEFYLTSGVQAVRRSAQALEDKKTEVPRELSIPVRWDP